MNKRLLAIVSALLITAVWFPAPVNCAEGNQTDTAIEGNVGEVYSDGDTPGDSFGESGDDGESETESNVETATASEGNEGPEAEPEEVAERETGPKTRPQAFGLGGGVPLTVAGIAAVGGAGAFTSFKLRGRKGKR